MHLGNILLFIFSFTTLLPSIHRFQKCKMKQRGMVPWEIVCVQLRATQLLGSLRHHFPSLSAPLQREKFPLHFSLYFYREYTARQSFCFFFFSLRKVLVVFHEYSKIFPEQCQDNFFWLFSEYLTPVLCV